MLWKTFSKPWTEVLKVLALAVWFAFVSMVHTDVQAQESTAPSGHRSIELLNKGEVTDALAEAEAALRDNPLSEEALIARAYIRANFLDDGRSALSDLRRLASLSSAEDDPFHGAGYSRLVLEEIDKAVEFYAEAFGIVLEHPVELTQ